MIFQKIKIIITNIVYKFKTDIFVLIITVALTSIQAPGQQVPLAGGALKVRSGPVYKGARLPGLSLCPSTVSKLWTHHQETLRRRFWRHQPGEKEQEPAN